MDVICFICNKPSSGWHRNFTELKLQHTDTPICEFIKTLLADFNSTRIIDNESNHICIECWLQFNEYDLAQTIEQEAKLRNILLSTEMTLRSIKNTPMEIENEIEDDSYFVRATKNTEIELEPNVDVAGMFVQQTASSTTQISTSILKRSSNLIPATESEGKRTLIDIRKSIAKQNRYLVRKNGEIHMRTTTKDGKSRTPTRPKESSSSVKRAEKLQYPKPAFPYECLIALALKNSHSGSLPIAEIYSFIWEYFPCFRSERESWKYGIQRTLSSNECFKKIEYEIIVDGVLCEGFLWTMCPSEIDERIQNCIRSNAVVIRSSMAIPQLLPALIRGEMKCDNKTTELNNKDCPDFELKPGDEPAGDMIISSGDDNAQDEYNDDAFNAFIEPDEVSFDDSKPVQLTPNYPKPKLNNIALIALALKNSHTGSLAVPEIYNFMCEHFPYFKTASTKWQRSLRNALLSRSSHKSFMKTDRKIRIGGVSKTKYCLYKLNPLEISRMDDMIWQWSQNADDCDSMAVPENLPALLRGEMKHGSLCDSSTELNDTADDLKTKHKPVVEFPNQWKIQYPSRNRVK